MFTEFQFMVFTGLVGIVVSVMTARATASSEAVKSLNLALTSLRTEFEANKEARKVEQRERDAYKAYIETLVKLLNAHGITVPPFPGWDEESE